MAFQHFVAAHEELLLTPTPVTLQLSGPEVDSALAGLAAVRIRWVEAAGPLAR